MSQTHRPQTRPQPPSADIRIDVLCDQFEAAWQAERPPRLENYLSQLDEATRAEAVRELLRVELELRRRQGEKPQVDEYCRRFPDHAEAVAEAFGETHGHDQTSTSRGPGSDGGGLSVRCPHCHGPNQIAPDSSLTDLVCQQCGSKFSLVTEEIETQALGTVTSLGHFQLLERLGIGGFGTVWKARDTNLARTVAVKIPRQNRLDAWQTEQFLREARAAAQLRHPNIVSVHEVGRHADKVYIVCDYIRGLALDDWLSGQQLTGREAAALCAKIALALDYAHQQGVIHRDLKPGNILLDDDGAPHLMDFGLARREVGEVTMTLEGQVLGTPAYMSPEQAQGEAHTADRRSDIYSLGVVMFQLLTGELPFRGNARMLIHQVIHEEPPSPRKLNANIHRDLETICLKCLQKQPKARYQTSAEVANELQHYLEGKPIEARPISQATRAWRWCQRNPAVAALATMVLLLILATSVGATVAAIHQAALRKEAEQNEETALWNAYVSRMAAVEDAWEERDLGQLEVLLEQQVPEPGKPDFRGWEWYYLKGQCDQSWFAVPGTSPVWHPTKPRFAVVNTETARRRVDIYSADSEQLLDSVSLPYSYEPTTMRLLWTKEGLFLANVEKASRSRVIDLTTGIVVFDKHTHEQPHAWDITKDGSTLAIASDSGISIWDVQTQEKLKELADPDSVWITRTVGISPDGRKIALSKRGGDRTSWDFESGQWTVHTPTRNWHGSVTWNQVGTLFAATDSGTLAVYRPGEADPIAVVDFPSSIAPTQVPWLSDTVLAIATTNMDIRTTDIRKPSESTKIRLHASAIEHIAVSHDKQYLASATSNVTKISHVQTEHPGYLVLESERVASGSQAKLLWSAQDSRIASICIEHQRHREFLSRLRIYGFHQCERIATSPPQDCVFKGIGWDESRGRLLTVEYPYTLRVWSPSSGEEIETIEVPVKWRVEEGIFSDDGKLLAVTNWGDIAILRVGPPMALLHQESLGSVARINNLAGFRWLPNSHQLAVRTADRLFTFDIGDSPASPVVKRQFRNGLLVWASESSSMRAVSGVQDNPKFAGFLKVRWSPNNERIASVEELAIRIWDASTGDTLLRLHSPDNADLAAARWSHDGLRLAAITRDGRIYVWGVQPMEAVPESATGLRTGKIAAAMAAGQ